VTIEPVDPVARHIIRLAVTSDRAAARNPRAVSTFVRTDAQSVAADVGANVCTHIHHFSSRQTADHAMARCSIVRVDAPMIRRGPSLVPARRATKVDQKAATRQRCKR
jgi:hypothetical protein